MEMKICNRDAIIFRKGSHTCVIYYPIGREDLAIRHIKESAFNAGSEIDVDDARVLTDELMTKYEGK